MKMKKTFFASLLVSTCYLAVDAKRTPTSSEPKGGVEYYPNLDDVQVGEP